MEFQEIIDAISGDMAKLFSRNQNRSEEIAGLGTALVVLAATLNGTGALDGPKFVENLQLMLPSASGEAVTVIREISETLGRAFASGPGGGGGAPNLTLILGGRVD